MNKTTLMARALAPFVACLLFIGCNLSQKKSDAVAPDTPPPKLLAPSVRKIWISPRLKDGGQEWEAGHYIYRIERNTSWSR